jgi:nitrogen fixation protein NifZ
VPSRLHRTGVNAQIARSSGHIPDESLPEVYGPPKFVPGQKVRARAQIRSDGTVPGKERGTFVVETGDVGYVTGIGEFLQRYYVYTVDFITRGRLIGMRGGEIELMEE